MAINFSAIGRLGDDWQTYKTHKGDTYIKNFIFVPNYDFKTSSILNLVVFGDSRIDTLKRYSKKGSKMWISGTIEVVNDKEKQTIYHNVNLEKFEFLDDRKNQESRQENKNDQKDEGIDWDIFWG